MPATSSECSPGLGQVTRVPSLSRTPAPGRPPSRVLEKPQAPGRNSNSSREEGWSGTLPRWAPRDGPRRPVPLRSPCAEPDQETVRGPARQ